MKLLKKIAAYENIWKHIYTCSLLLIIIIAQLNTILEENDVLFENNLLAYNRTEVAAWVSFFYSNLKYIALFFIGSLILIKKYAVHC